MAHFCINGPRTTCEKRKKFYHCRKIEVHTFYAVIDNVFPFCSEPTKNNVDSRFMNLLLPELGINKKRDGH